MATRFIQELSETIRKHRLEDHQDVAPIVWRIQTGRITESQARLYLIWLEPLIEEATLRPHVLLPPPDEEQLYAEGKPEIELGRIRDGPRFGISPGKEPRHMLVAGASSTGKTVFLRNLCIGFRRHSETTGKNIVLIIIDPKADFTDLPWLCGGKWLLLDAGSTLRVGLQRPKGVGRTAWTNSISASYGARFNLVASRSTFSEVYGWSTEVLSAEDQGSDLSPNPGLIHEIIQASPGSSWASKEEYERTLLHNTQDAMHAGPVFDCFRGLDLDEMISAGTNVIISYESLTLPPVRAWLVDLLVSQIFESRLARHHKTDTTEVVLIIDESDEFASRAHDAVFPLAMSPIGKLLKQGRELGIMAVLSVSVLKNVSPFILSNTHFQHYFCQADTDSIQEARHALLLPPEADRLISALPRGQCLFRHALTCWPTTMHADIDYVPPYRGGRPQYDTHPFVPARRLKEMPELKEALNKRIGAYRAAKHAEKKIDAPAVSETARKVLSLMTIHPYLPWVRLWEKLARSSSDGERAGVRKELEQVCHFEAVRIGKKEQLLVEPNNSGFKILGMTPTEKTGGGLSHRAFCAWIADFGRGKGCRSDREWTAPGQPEGAAHRADVVWFENGHISGFEVVSKCSSNLCQHIRRSLIESNIFATVTVVAATEKELRPLRRMVQADPQLADVQERIKYDVITSYMSFEETMP